MVVFQGGGDEESLEIWRQLIDTSKAGFNEAYDRLNVLLTDATWPANRPTTTTCRWWSANSRNPASR